MIHLASCEQCSIGLSVERLIKIITQYEIKRKIKLHTHKESYTYIVLKTTPFGSGVLSFLCVIMAFLVPHIVPYLVCFLCSP